MRTLLLTFLLFFFTACTAQSYNYHSQTQTLHFKTDTQSTYKIALEDPKRVYTHDVCTNFSYTLEDNSKNYGALFLEHISLDNDCKYNGLAMGFFTYEFQNYLKLKSFKKVESQSFANYEFTTYEVNGSSYISFIHQYQALSDTFIIDYKGQLSLELIRQFDKNYVSNYINKTRFNQAYNQSLVRLNIFKNFFNKESDNFSQ